MRRTLWLLGALGLVVSACGGGGHTAADPKTTPAPAPSLSAPTSTTNTEPASTATTVPDPVNIPATITVAYVNAVLARLNHVYGEAQRIEIATKFLPKSIPPLLRAIYGDVQYNRELSVFSQALLNTNFDKLNLNAPDPQAGVATLRSASPTCIQAAVAIIDDAKKSGPSSPLDLFIVLRPKVSANDPNKVNTTPWEITYELSSQPLSSDAC